MLPAIPPPPATIWMVDDTPSRMVFAGHRWRVSDTPTRLREALWRTPGASRSGPSGWRFQGTNEDGRSLVFDVLESVDGWHVHHCYD